MSRFEEDALSCDAFLGGRLRIWQPRAGYRAGIDPVMLAAAVPARAGQSVLELGCGAGTASLCLAARVPDLTLTGVELQAEYAALAERNARDNVKPLEVVEADLAALPAELRQRRFDHVLMNPPYYRAGAHSSARDAGRQVALGEITPLSLWVEVAARRLAPKGYLHVIQNAERLPDLLIAAEGRLGSVEVLPLAAREGREADRVILRMRKGGRAAFRLHAPLILHEGAVHQRDGESYRAEIDGILRKAAELVWPA